jgi:hypothetical protein
MEIWKEVYGFPHYEVSNLGHVRSKDKFIYQKDPHGNGVKVLRKGREITGGLDPDGYRHVLLYYSSGGNRWTAKVHRLVANAFIPSERHTDLLQVNHKDGNKQNNAVENLEWVTSQENITHAQRLGLRKARLIARKDLITGETLEEYETTIQIKEQGFRADHVKDCCLGKRKSHKGFQWAYLD